MKKCELFFVLPFLGYLQSPTNPPTTGTPSPQNPPLACPVCPAPLFWPGLAEGLDGLDGIASLAPVAISLPPSIPVAATNPGNPQGGGTGCTLRICWNIVENYATATDVVIQIVEIFPQSTPPASLPDCISIDEMSIPACENGSCPSSSAPTGENCHGANVDRDHDGVDDWNPFWDEDGDGIPDLYDMDFDWSPSQPGVQHGPTTLLPSLHHANLLKLWLSQHGLDASALIDKIVEGGALKLIEIEGSDGQLQWSELVPAAREALQSFQQQVAASTNLVFAQASEFAHPSGEGQPPSIAQLNQDFDAAIALAKLMKSAASSFQQFLQQIDANSLPGGVAEWSLLQTDLAAALTNIDKLIVVLESKLQILAMLDLGFLEADPNAAGAGSQTVNVYGPLLGLLASTIVSPPPDGTPGVKIKPVDDHGADLSSTHVPPSWGQTPANPPTAKSQMGDPISTWDGAFLYQKTDVAIAGRGIDFVLTRFYSSRENRGGFFGFGWSSFLESHLLVYPGMNHKSLEMFWGNGHRSYFEWKSAWNRYEGKFGERSKIRRYESSLEPNENCEFSGGYVLREPTGNLLYFCAPTLYPHLGGASIAWLRKISDSHGNSIQILRDSFGHPTQVIDSLGRVYEFTIDAERHLVTSVRDPLGRVVSYEYATLPATGISESGSIISGVTGSSTSTAVVALLSPRLFGSNPSQSPLKFLGPSNLVRVNYSPSLHLAESGQVLWGNPYERYTYSSPSGAVPKALYPSLSNNLTAIADNDKGPRIQIAYNEDWNSDSYDRAIATTIDDKMSRFSYLPATSADPFSQPVARIAIHRASDGTLEGFFHGTHGELLREEAYESRDLDGNFSQDNPSGQIWATLYDYNADFLPTVLVSTTQDGYSLGKMRRAEYVYDSQNTDSFQRANLLRETNFPDPSLASPGDPPKLDSEIRYDALSLKPYWTKDNLGRISMRNFAHQEQSLDAVQSSPKVSGWGIAFDPLQPFALGDINTDGKLGGDAQVVREIHPPVTIASPAGPGNPTVESLEDLYRYNDFGQLIAHRDTSGVWTEIQYENGYPKRVIEDSLGVSRSTNFVYDTLGRLTKTILPDNSEICTVRDPRGQTIEIRQKARPGSTEDGQEIVRQLFFDLSGNAVGAKQPFLAIAGMPAYGVGYLPSLDIKVSFNAAGQPIETTARFEFAGQVQAGSWKKTYDELGRVLCTENPLGGILCVERNTRYLPVRIVRTSTSSATAGDLGIFETSYNEYGESVLSVQSVDADGDGLNDRSEIVRNGYGWAIRSIRPDGSEIRVGYDSGQRILEEEIHKNGILQARHWRVLDSWDRVIREESANLRLALDGSASPISPPVLVSEFGYGRRTGELLWSSLDPQGKALLRRYQYDSLGRLQASFLGTTNDVGTIKTMDLFDRVIEERIRHDGQGNLGVVNPSESILRAIYDGFGRIEASIDALGNATSLQYNAAGLLASAIDPTGRRIAFTYDSGGRRRASTETGIDGRTRTVQFEYDGLGEVTAIVDALGRRTEYEHDSWGRLRTRRFPDSSEVHFVYDESDRLRLQIEAGGVSRAFDYDSSGRIRRTLAFGADAGVEQNFTYGALGHLSRTTDKVGNFPEVVVTRVFSSQGNLLEESCSRSGTTTSQSFEYGGSNFLEKVHYPSGSNVERGYDALGRLTSLRSGNETIAQMTPYGASQSKEIALANGIRFEIDRNAKGQITRKVSFASNSTALAGGSYEYDEAGNLQTRTRVIPGQNSALDAFEYDGLHRLKLWKAGLDASGIAQRTLTWDHDLANNVTSKTDSLGSAIVPSNNALNQLVQYGSGVSSLSYSPRGEELARTLEGGAMQWKWDALGRPFQQTISDATTGVTQHSIFFYDSFGKLFERLDGVSGETNRYSYLGNAISQRQNSAWGWQEFVLDQEGHALQRRQNDGQTLGIHVDPFWNVGAILDNHAAVESYAYEPYGRVLNGQTGSALDSSAVNNELFFLGLPHDLRSGISQTGHRFFDTRLERFLSRDPLGEAGGLNLYDYADRNPMRWIDPSGLSKQSTQTPKHRQAKLNKKSAILALKTKYWWRGMAWDQCDDPHCMTHYLDALISMDIDQMRYLGVTEDDCFAGIDLEKKLGVILYAFGLNAAMLDTIQTLAQEYTGGQSFLEAHDVRHRIGALLDLHRSLSTTFDPLAIGLELGVSVGSSIIPGGGEVGDTIALQDPNAPEWVKTVAGCSLGLNSLTGGFAPNFGKAAALLSRLSRSAGKFRPGKAAVNLIDAIEEGDRRVQQEVARFVERGLSEMPESSLALIAHGRSRRMTMTTGIGLEELTVDDLTKIVQGSDAQHIFLGICNAARTGVARELSLRFPDRTITAFRGRFAIRMIDGSFAGMSPEVYGMLRSSLPEEQMIPFLNDIDLYTDEAVTLINGDPIW